MAEPDQLVAWSGFIALILVARLLLTRRARVFLGPHISRLADWWVARRRASEVDHEYDELALVLRRQELSAHVARLRRIVATDESMSATRQIANRLAYRGLLRDLEETRDMLPWMADDDAADRWSSAVVPIRRSRYDSHRAAPEVLEIGWRR